VDSEKLLESFDYNTVKMIRKNKKKHNDIVLVDSSNLEILKIDKKEEN